MVGKSETQDGAFYSDEACFRFPERTSSREGDTGFNGLRCLRYFSSTPLSVLSDKVSMSNADEDECALLNRTACCSSAEQSFYEGTQALWRSSRRVPNVHPCVVAKPGTSFEDGSVCRSSQGGEVEDTCSAGQFLAGVLENRTCGNAPVRSLPATAFECATLAADLGLPYAAVTGGRCDVLSECTEIPAESPDAFVLSLGPNTSYPQQELPVTRSDVWPFGRPEVYLLELRGSSFLPVAEVSGCSAVLFASSAFAAAGEGSAKALADGDESTCYYAGSESSLGETILLSCPGDVQVKFGSCGPGVRAFNLSASTAQEGPWTLLASFVNASVPESDGAEPEEVAAQNETADEASVESWFTEAPTPTPTLAPTAPPTPEPTISLVPDLPVPTLPPTPAPSAAPTTAAPAPSPAAGPVEAMEVQATGKQCKGKAKTLVKSAATAEKCQAACLADPECKFLTLRRKGKAKKWKCMSHPTCKKLKAKKDHDVYKKSKVKAAEASDPKYFTLTDSANVRLSVQDDSSSDQNKESKPSLKKGGAASKKKGGKSARSKKRTSRDDALFM
jgi:hypothetical protein